MITPLRVKKGPERSTIKIFSREIPAAFLGDRRNTSVSRDARCNFPPFDGVAFRRGAEQRPFCGTALRDETRQAERKRVRERVCRTGPSVVAIKCLRGFTIFSFFLSRCRVSTLSSDWTSPANCAAYWSLTRWVRFCRQNSWRSPRLRRILHFPLWSDTCVNVTLTTFAGESENKIDNFVSSRDRRAMTCRLMKPCFGFRKKLSSTRDQLNLSASRCNYVTSVSFSSSRFSDRNV